LSSGQKPPRVEAQRDCGLGSEAGVAGDEGPVPLALVVLGQLQVGVGSHWRVAEPAQFGGGFAESGALAALVACPGEHETGRGRVLGETGRGAVEADHAHHVRGSLRRL
jgi:hypothetical protein